MRTKVLTVLIIKVLTALIINVMVLGAAEVFADEMKNEQEINERFIMQGKERSFCNDDRYIVFRQNENIAFASSLQSQGTSTWFFGDGKTEANSGDVTHSYKVPGAYAVKLRASGAGDSGASVKEVSGLIHIYGDEVAKNAACKEYRADWGATIKPYNEQELMSLVVLLRRDRDTKKNLKGKLERVLGDLSIDNQISDDQIRRSMLSGLIKQVQDAAAEQGSDGSTYLKNIETLLTKIKDVNDGRENRQKTIEKAMDDAQLVKNEFIAYEDRVLMRCDGDIARAENRLREKGNGLERKQTSLKQDMKNEDLYEKQKTEIDRAYAENKALLNDVRGVTPITYNDLFQTYDDYKQYFFKFYLGYEYASTVKDLLKKGVPRAGFTVQYRAWERDIPDAEPDSFGGHFGVYGVQTTFHALVTGSAEQDTILTSSATSTLVSSSTPTIKNTGENKALEGDVDVFVPLYRTSRFNDGKLWGYMGPVVSLGIKKADDVTGSTGNIVDNYDRRAYAGVMLAFNPELYTEVLWGKTSGLKSDRMEVRAQLPVYKFTNESRFLLGAIANIGVRHRQPDETDVIRVFLTWNVNFENVYEYFSGNKVNTDN